MRRSIAEAVSLVMALAVVSNKAIGATVPDPSRTAAGEPLEHPTLTTSAALAQSASEGKLHVSAALQPALRRANEAIKKKDYGVALEQLEIADAMPNKTPDDQSVIGSMRRFIEARLKFEMR